jgi:hypothetical protein
MKGRAPSSPPRWRDVTQRRRRGWTRIVDVRDIVEACFDPWCTPRPAIEHGGRDELRVGGHRADHQSPGPRARPLGRTTPTASTAAAITNAASRFEVDPIPKDYASRSGWHRTLIGTRHLFIMVAPY